MQRASITKTLPAISMALAVCVSIASVDARSIRGTVVDAGGKVMEGVTVSAFDEERRQSVSVFSQADGSFTIDGLRDVRFNLRARLPGQLDRWEKNVAARPGSEGGATETHATCTLHRGIPEIPSPVLYRDRIDLVSDGGILSVVHAGNGKMVYRKRLDAIGHYRSSPVIANDHLYVISEGGTVSVAKTGDDFELVHQVALDDEVAATPAIDASTIYIRTKSQLLAFRGN